MMRPLILAAAGAALLAGAAHAQPARDYVMKAGASDLFEKTEANLALQRTRNPRVREFARMMVKDHTTSTQQVKAAARQLMGHNPPPPMLDEAQRSMVADLRHQRGRDFDRTYVDQQVQAHQQALDLHQGYAQSGDAPPLRRAAEGIVPVVQHHLDMVKDMQANMR